MSNLHPYWLHQLFLVTQGAKAQSATATLRGWRRGYEVIPPKNLKAKRPKDLTPNFTLKSHMALRKLRRSDLCSWRREGQKLGQQKDLEEVTTGELAHMQALLTRT
ncbi:MAG: hypothetical protein J5905_05200 [Prevotella sp.]|nr:hypothetical protein [Prevotella sp.]